MIIDDKVISISTLLISVGFAWGYVKTKLRGLDTRCEERRESCQKALHGKIDTLCIGLHNLEKANRELSKDVENFMLDLKEWKGAVDVRLNNGDRRVKTLERGVGN